MTTSLLSKRQCGYTKMQIEDPEDIQHRKAQFLIYKVLQQAASDSSPRRRTRSTRRSSSWLRIRICRLKIKIGKKLKKLKKSIFLGMGNSNTATNNCGARKQAPTSGFKISWKRFFAVKL